MKHIIPAVASTNAVIAGTPGSSDARTGTAVTEVEPKTHFNHVSRRGDLRSTRACQRNDLQLEQTAWNYVCKPCCCRVLITLLFRVVWFCLLVCYCFMVSLSNILFFIFQLPVRWKFSRLQRGEWLMLSVTLDQVAPLEQFSHECSKFVPVSVLKTWPNGCNMLVQHRATLLHATRCVRLATMLHNVAFVWPTLLNIMQNDPTMLHATCCICLALA